MIDGSGTGRIADFGFSIELPKHEGGRSLFTAKFYAKTEGYYAAEVSSGKYSEKSDVFSYGIVSTSITDVAIVCIYTIIIAYTYSSHSLKHDLTFI